MSSMRWPPPSPDPEPVAYLTVTVYPLSGGSRWEWHLVDERDGSLFERGLDYETRLEARRAAYERLAELTPSLSESPPSVDARKPSARITSTPRTTDQPSAESA
jgi:hypothetical protein